MSSVFTGTIPNALKNTLNAIVDDDTDGIEANAQFTKWAEIKSQEDNYEDDLETGGPGLASEKAEGAEIATGTIREGFLTRYIARTFGLKLIISEEALEDNKYPKVIQAARRLKRALWKTADIDCTMMLVRATSSSYVGGDGVSLASSSHTLPSGGTWSNTMATPFSPSRAAMIIATSQVRKYPGHDGITEGCQPKRILCPLEQWAVWDGLINSTKAPESNTNEINVVNKLDLEVVPLKFWSNTTTNWALQTDCDNGLQFRWRRRPRNRSWVDNDHENMKYSISARWSRGWSDARSILFSNA